MRRSTNLREREVLELTEAVKMLTELLERTTPTARDDEAENGLPS
jgi:hypothetical protein